MDLLTAFGLFAVTAMLVCYALEDRSAWFVLAFAGACALGSVYGFLQGAWPLGVVDAIRGHLGRAALAEARSGVAERCKFGNAKASHDLRATFKLLIQAAVLRRSVRQRVPFDGDVAPSAFDVVVGGGAAKFLAVQRFRPIFLGDLHARYSHRGGSMQRSQSPPDTKKMQ